MTDADELYADMLERFEATAPVMTVTALAITLVDGALHDRCDRFSLRTWIGDHTN